MPKSYIKDMTVGNVFNLLISFSIPMLVGNLFQQVYGMVDSIVVGKYVGAKALAAVGATGSLNFLFFSLCFGLSSGIGILISQYFGAGHSTDVKRSIFNSIYIIASTGVVMTILGIIFAKPILLLLDTPSDIIADSTTYMQITCAGTLAVSAYNCISSILRALGDSKTPLIFLIVASAINIVLDLVFVIVLHMEVAGVGYATIIAQLLSAIGCLIFALKTNPYFKLTSEDRIYDKKIITKCCRLGIPLAAQSSLIAVSCVALQRVVNSFGSTVVAAFTATSRIEQLIQQPFNSLSMALATFAGQNLGAKKLDRISTAFKKSVLIIAVFSILMTIIFFIFGKEIMHIFVNEENVIDFGETALKITSVFYFALGIIYVSRGLLNGVGDSVFSLINGICEVICRILFANTLIFIPAINKWGVWLATCLTWFVTGIISYLRYRIGKWKGNKL